MVMVPGETSRAAGTLSRRRADARTQENVTHPAIAFPGLSRRRNSHSGASAKHLGGCVIWHFARRAVARVARVFARIEKKRRQTMVALKKIMMGIGLAALVITSTSVMAQSYQPEVGSGNIVRKE